MGEDIKQVGPNVKRLRVAAGLTQQQLAGQAGLSLSGLAGIEQGTKENVQLATLMALAKALGVTAAELLNDGTDRPKRKK